MSRPLKLLSRDECQRRLAQIFPPQAVSDRQVRGPQAAAAVFVARYISWDGAMHPMRPSTVLWFCDAVAKRKGAATRKAWYEASTKSHRAVTALVESWNVEHRPWYKDTSREPLRDETFHRWLEFGAIHRDESGETTSSKGVWTLDPDFAALFDPALKGDALNQAIDDWQQQHLGTVALTRAAVARQLTQAQHGVAVSLPTGQTRRLSAGGSSLIVKGIVEQLAPQIMGKPAVLAISESATKVDVVDAALLRQLGLTIQADRLLPDVLLFDADEGNYWFGEAVFTNGVITETRRQEFLSWAATRGIPAANCRFVTAFSSRAANPIRKRIADLAWNTLVWFLDEPDHVMHLQ